MEAYFLNIKILFNFVFLFEIITISKGELFWIDATRSSIDIMYINNSSKVNYIDESFKDLEEQEKDITQFC